MSWDMTTQEKKKRGIGFYMLVGLGVLVVLSVLTNKDKGNSPARNTASTPSASRPAPEPPTPPTPPTIDAKVSAKELFKAYENNEIAADGRYKGKLLEVSGKIDNIGKDLLDTPYITLEVGEFQIMGVQAFFDDDSLSKLASLSKGQGVTLQCRCDGKFGNVMLKECALR